MIENILSLKQIITDGKGRQILDLWQRSIQYITNKMTIASTVIVTKDFKMRPDLISQAAWGDTNNADIIMKYNSISNPFSINMGDILIIPDYEQMLQQLYQPDVTTSQTITNTPDTQTIQFKNVAKQQYNARNSANSNTPISSNSPNQAEPGDQETITSGGNIYFGPSVGSSNSLNQSISKAAVLASIQASTNTTS